MAVTVVVSAVTAPVVPGLGRAVGGGVLGVVAASTALAVPVAVVVVARRRVGVASGVGGVVFARAGTCTGMSWEKEALPQSPSTAGTRAATIASA